VRLLATAVAALMDSDPEMQLVSISGGDKRNALPREASAVLAVGSRRSLILPDRNRLPVSLKAPSTLSWCLRGALLRVQVPQAAVPAVHEVVARKQADFVAEYGLLEATLCLQSNVGGAAEGQALVPDSAEKLLTLLLTLPHG
jgi:hypothetical protein